METPFVARNADPGANAAGGIAAAPVARKAVKAARCVTVQPRTVSVRMSHCADIRAGMPVPRGSEALRR